MGNDASRLQGGYDPIAELKTLTTIASGLPQFSLSAWKAHVEGMEINRENTTVFFRTVLKISLDEYYQYWKNSTYEMIACKVFAFLLRHVSLEMKTIVFHNSAVWSQRRNNIKFQLFRYVKLMIKKEDDVQGIKKLKELMHALDWMKPWRILLRNEIWKSATSKEMLELLDLVHFIHHIGCQLHFINMR